MITVVENREFKQQQRLQLSQKTSLKNKHLRKHDYFVIIAHCKTLHLEISRPTRRLADQVKENALKCALQVERICFLIQAAKQFSDVLVVTAVVA